MLIARDVHEMIELPDAVLAKRWCLESAVKKASAVAETVTAIHRAADVGKLLAATNSLTTTPSGT